MNNEHQALPPLPVEIEEAINFVNNVPNNLHISNNNYLRNRYVQYFEHLL